MKNIFPYLLLTLMITGCSEKKNNTEVMTPVEKEIKQKEMINKAINKNLPTIGILIFEGVIINEVIASFDVFSQSDESGNALFNVAIIGKENKTYQSAHGLKILPDFTISNTPALTVLVVPSSYNPEEQTQDIALVNFIKEQNKTTEYIASHCAGAFLLGEAGIADNKKIVTYCGGGESLQSEYPLLKVLDDTKFSVVEDGKIISSNGNLVSYLAALSLLEKMTSKKHKKYVEEQLLLNKLAIEYADK